ncbi:serine hydrolase [Nocardia sp. NPDC004604]|uniref:serine hydrolase n=1 Tax=Nocardia sp. NPDC004604 TaxID=3157013 RepID=UPI00339F6297
MIESAPTTTAQLDWIVSASTRSPLPDREIRDHLASGLLDASGGADGFNAALMRIGRLVVGEIVAARPDFVQAAVHGDTGNYLVTVRTNTAGLIEEVRLTADVPPPASWAEIDTRLARLGRRVSFAAAEIEPDDHCRIVHGLNPDTLRPIGSAFKLYVLGALAHAVAEGRVGWDERLAIRDDWKSLPSGTMQNRPAGATASLAEYADLMISISDNTATDHLIHQLGRDAVERQLRLFGHRQPDTNTPFLTTKAFFQLKGNSDTTRAQRYLALSPHDRVAALEQLEHRPLPDLQETWPEPTHIDQIEWFAAPTDICHAFAGLAQLDQPEIGHALSQKDEGLNLDTRQFPTVWYKGGSEPGVVTLHYLARTTDDRTLATSLMVSDPHTTLDTLSVTLAGQSVIRGAFHLLAHAQ